MAADASRRDTVAAAATAVLVVVLGVAFVVVRNLSEDDGTTTAPAATRAGPASCGAGDLAVTAVARDRAGGSSYLTATLRLARGAEPCTVRGYPEVIVLSGGRPAGVANVPDRTLGRPDRLTVLPDRSARVTLAWAPDHYCGPVVNDAIRLWVAADLAVELPGFGATSCAGDEGRPPVRVGAYSYVDPRAELGSVTGVVTLNDGPGLGTGEFVTSGEVRLEGVTDTYRGSIGPSGSFTIDAAAGTYDVQVTTHQWHHGETYPAGSFDVAAGELQVLNLLLPAR